MLAPILAAALVFATIAPGATTVHAAAPLMRGLSGHWSCAGGNATERSYLAYHYVPAGETAARTDIYGRADTTTGGAIEHIFRASDSDPYTVVSPDGNGTGTVTRNGDFAAAGTDATSGKPFTITMSLAGGVLTRTVVTSSGTITERCTAESPTPAPAVCTQPDRAARVTEAAPLSWAGHTGSVAVIVTLDDRSEVLWTEVQTHLAEAEDIMAVQATRTSHYQTAVKNCRPIPGRFIFTSTWEE